MQTSVLDAATLRLLACPVCHAALTMEVGSSNQGSEVVCSGCRRRYPMRDGLPVLLASAAAS